MSSARSSMAVTRVWPTQTQQRRARNDAKEQRPGTLRCFGRGERTQTSATDLNVPACLLLEVEVTGTERWIRGSVG